MVSFMAAARSVPSVPVPCLGYQGRQREQYRNEPLYPIPSPFYRAVPT